MLVLLEDDAGPEVLEGRVSVVHSASPRLLVPRLTTLGEITALPGVVAVTDKALPDELVEQLDDTEARFAVAFAGRGRKRDRVGEGLDWDAPGFEPPDPEASADQTLDQKGDNDA